MRLIWYPAVSLDGFITDSAGASTWVTPEDERQFAKLIHSAGALVVGRRTFDQYHRPNPFPKIRTYVLTSNSSLASDDPAVVYVTGGPMEVMRRLHQDGYQMAVLSGGGRTNGAFASKGLIDEAWVSLYPFTLGAGTPLLGDYQINLRFELQSAHMMPSGVVHSRYKIA